MKSKKLTKLVLFSKWSNKLFGTEEFIETTKYGNCLSDNWWLGKIPVFYPKLLLSEWTYFLYYSNSNIECTLLNPYVIVGIKQVLF